MLPDGGADAANAATVREVDAASRGRTTGFGRRPERRPAKRALDLSKVGHAAPIVFTTGLGLLVCSIANALSRTAHEPSPLIFWIGVLVMALPIFHRLTGRDASARERLFLVCLLGLSLYCVKVFRDAPLFTFSDELVHAYNANQIADHHHLFRNNPILEVTPYYQGLEGAASALMKLTGISSYAAGVILVAAARLVLIASLFLLFQRVSNSARVAGLGAAIYAGNFNFLYWGAQFSYESLALPLLLMLMMAAAEREAAPKKALGAWAVPILLATAAIVVTHHLTSYATVGVLAALAIAYWYVHRSWRPPNPWGFAVAAALMALFWLLVVASNTVGYLSPVLSNAIDAISNTVGGEDAPRGLFQGAGSTVPPTPLAAKGISLLAVALLAGALPFGLRAVLRRFRRQPFALLFGLAAIGFFATLALRLAPPAWETGNRASEFLFVGLAFVLACACVEALRRGWLGSAARPLLAGAIGVVLVGGAIAGWPWDSLMAQPMKIAGSGGTVSSPPLAMAEWAEDEVPEGRFAASVSDSGLLLVPGAKVALSGTSPDVEDILDSESLADWELPLLRRNHLRYVALDRRDVSDDALRGYYFEREDDRGELQPKSVVTKFSQVPGVSRPYTNGVITVIDVEGNRR